MNFFQLPHISEDILKHFSTRKRNIKTLHQLARMKDEERRSLLRTLTDEQYRDVIRVLSLMPVLNIKVIVNATCVIVPFFSCIDGIDFAKSELLD